MKDEISLERSKQLHPKCMNTFRAFIEECENTFDITLRIMLPVYRTIDEQNALYAQGRTTKGQKVTNAKGGQSYHNYGLAIDLCVLDTKDADKDGDTKEVLWSYDNAALSPIAAKHGIEWGGNWQSTKDRPHFQISYGYSWQQLLDLHNANKVDPKGYVLI
jgi:hypothetical protein